jgi:hypothetical protein
MDITISQIGEKNLVSSSKFLLSEEKLNNFVNTVNLKKLLNLNRFIQFPLKFESVQDEIVLLLLILIIMITISFYDI